MSNDVSVRRFRMINGSFDTRSFPLQDDISPSWEPAVRAMHWENRLQAIEWVRHEFGEDNLGEKIADLTALGVEPFSVLAFHNVFFQQVRRSFIVGSHYPALVGCCALGERILNHLIREFRDDFKATTQYKSVYDKQSIDDWSRAIDVLEAWELLLPSVAEDFRQLRVKRNDAIHFRPETATGARTMALAAIQLLARIIDGQFGMMGPKPWYFEAPGETYVRADAESWPFVARLIVPAGLLVGPSYELVFDAQTRRWAVATVGDAGPDTGTDAEFLALRSG